MRGLFIALGIAAIFLGWNAPNHYPPWPAFHLELFAGLGLCLLAVATVGAGRKMPPLHAAAQPVPASVWVWLLIATLPPLQYAAGQLHFRGDAVIGLLYGLSAGFAVWVGHLLVVQHGRARVLQAMWLTIVAGAMAANALALVQWLRLGPPSWWAMELIDDRPFANFGQPNHFGLLMVMAIVAITALFELRVVQHRWVHRAAMVFFGAGVLISGSRASVLALFALGMLWTATRRRAATRLGWHDVAGGVVVAFLMAAAHAQLEHWMTTAPADVRLTTDVGARQWIWQHYGAAILERPWAGYGFNQGVAAMAEVAGQVHPSRNAVFAHNLLLDLMTWVGIPLGVLLLAALCAWTLGWLRKCDDAALVVQRHCVFAVWLALFVQSMLEFPYAHAYFLIPSALLAGAISAHATAQSATPMRKATRRTPLSAENALRLLGCAGALLFAVTVVDYFQIESEFRSHRFERANFTTKMPREEPRPVLVLDQLAAVNASARRPPTCGMSDQELEAMRVLARRFHFPWTRLDYARALALNRSVPEAERELQVIRSVNAPQSFERIERSWRIWLAANVCAVPEGRRQ